MQAETILEKGDNSMVCRSQRRILKREKIIKRLKEWQKGQEEPGSPMPSVADTEMPTMSPGPTNTPTSSMTTDAPTVTKVPTSTP